MRGSIKSGVNSLAHMATQLNSPVVVFTALGQRLAGRQEKSCLKERPKYRTVRRGHTDYEGQLACNSPGKPRYPELLQPPGAPGPSFPLHSLPQEDATLSQPRRVRAQDSLCPHPTFPDSPQSQRAGRRGAQGFGAFQPRPAVPRWPVAVPGQTCWLPSPQARP